MRVALLLPFWLMCVVGDPGFMHRCPQHGADGAHGAAHSHGAMHHDGQAPRTPSHTICTCVGSCCVPTAAALPALHEVPLAGIALFDTPLVSPAQSCVSRDVQLRLPWANGPPGSALI